MMERDESDLDVEVSTATSDEQENSTDEQEQEGATEARAAVENERAEEHYDSMKSGINYVTDVHNS